MEDNIPSVADEINLIRHYGAMVLAVVLNTIGMTEKETKVQQHELEQQVGLPVVAPIYEGVGRLVPVLKHYIENYQHEN